MATAVKGRGKKTAKEAVQKFKKSMEENLSPGASVEINGVKVAEGKKDGGSCDVDESSVEQVANQITDVIIGAIEEAESEITPEITGEELAAKIKAEKLRLEDLLCQQSEALTEATVEFNNANEEMKSRKKHLEAIQLRVNETAHKLSDVLQDRWRPDPQRELPFPEGSVGEQMDLKLWRSEPVQSLDLPKTILAKLDDEGFTTVGQLADELESQRFAGLEISEKQIVKIQHAVDSIVDRAESQAATTADEQEQPAS